MVFSNIINTLVVFVWSEREEEKVCTAGLSSLLKFLHFSIVADTSTPSSTTFLLSHYGKNTSFPSPASSSSLVLCLTLSPLYSVCPLSFLPTSSALRSCSTGDSLLSSAFIRSAKSAPALAPPLPVLLHHHHPSLPPLADQLAGTHSLHYLPALLSACRLCSWPYNCLRPRLSAVCPFFVSVCLELCMWSVRNRAALPFLSL